MRTRKSACHTDIERILTLFLNLISIQMRNKKILKIRKLHRKLPLRSWFMFLKLIRNVKMKDNCSLISKKSNRTSLSNRYKSALNRLIWANSPIYRNTVNFWSTANGCSQSFDQLSYLPTTLDWNGTIPKRVSLTKPKVHYVSRRSKKSDLVSIEINLY